MTPPTSRSRRPFCVATLAVVLLAPGILAVPGPAVAAGNARPTKVAVVFDGKTLTGFPKTTAGGITEVTLKNTGAFAVDVEFVRVSGIRTDAAISKAVNGDEPPPAWIEVFGGTTKAGGGSSTTATVNLDKGSYVWIVFAGGSELDGKTPFGRFTTTGAKSVTPPSGSASIVAKEYGYDITGLKAGPNKVAFSNAGQERHHAVMFRIKPGKTIQDVRKEIASDLQGPPKTVEETGTQELPLIDGGITMVADLTLVRGSYAFVCFMPDPKGRPHAQLGMVTEVKIS